MTKKICTIIALLTCTLLTIEALCQDSEDHEKAAKAFEAGVSFYNEGRYELACPLFDKAYSLRPSWKLWYNIAQCQAALKNYGVALDAFDNYLVGGGDELETSRTESVMAEMRRLKALVAEISVTGPDGGKIYVNERFRGELPQTPIIRVTAGRPHKVEIRVDDAVWLARDIKLGSGQQLRIERGKTEELADKSGAESPDEKIEDGQAAPLETSKSVEFSGEKKPVSPIIFWSSVGATAGLGVATGIVGVVAKNRYDKAKSTPVGSSEREDLSRAQVAGTVFAITTGAALITTAVLAFFTDFDGEKDSAEGQTVVLAPGHVGWMTTF